MRKSDRARIFRLCMCLVVVGIIILGAADHTAAASATGSPPDIRAFSADPLILPDGGHAVYMFEVWNATKIQVIEAGEIINEYNGPPSTTSKGKANGRTTYQIRAGLSDTFETTLVASNPGGTQKKTLTLSFATKSKPTSTSRISPASDNGTKARISKWGTQAPAPANLNPSALSSLAPWPGQFAICPSGCQSCLQPSEAAAKGLTQKCSEQPCYYSPDKTQYWYCYGEPKGWCCKDGKVTPATRDQCATEGGSWYATEAEATRACASPPGCWCCTNGRYGQTTADACANMGGTCYATQAQAGERCQPTPTPTYWCCRDGQVYQSKTPGTGCYATQAEAQRACTVFRPPITAPLTIPKLTPVVPNIK